MRFCDHHILKNFYSPPNHQTVDLDLYREIRFIVDSYQRNIS